MPLVRLTTNADFPDTNARNELLEELSARTAEILDKPEEYIMVMLERAIFLMAGRKGPAAFLDVRALGEMTPANTAGLSEALTSIVEKRLDVDPSRVFLNFTRMKGDDWGHGSRTFG